MYRTRIVLLSLGVLIIAASQAPAALVALNDAGFENVGATATTLQDNVNYRNWGSGNREIFTFNAGGAGAGNNESVWLIRGFTGNNLDSGDLRQDTDITGKTGAQYFAYATDGLRGAFQYVGQGSDMFTGDFELKVDVGTTARASYALQVVGFDDDTDLVVKVDIGGALSIAKTSGTGGFELHTLSLTSLTSGGAFEEKTLSGTFAGTYENIGILLGMDFGTVGGVGDRDNPSDMVGFDDVRLTAEVISISIATIPEPSSFLLAAFGVLSLGMLRRRRRSFQGL